ncbi:hypothetical protein PAP_07375 [Palaeococcus pacificus DY20341]|uniref:Uncharacterized protein n=1 Tax=Palaeococcus pacificus DY20341 TaxID=1343739 RepID=A0A075LSY3_9EURY|nr:hypothetical protein [Palaeococcus pacificus]AIF69865.1 hypothetical protein PAP_07375 [Palaeococcus pacificus DY20341]
MKEINIKIGSKRGALWIAPLLVIALLVWIARPWFHGLIMGFYRNPSIIYIIISLLLLFPCSIKAKLAPTNKNRAITGALVVVLILSLSASILSGALMNTALYNEYHPSSVSSEMSQLSTSKIRILPKFTAYKYALDTIEYARYTLGDAHLTIKDGSPVWGFYIVPDGAWNAIKLKDKGVLFVDMNTTQAKIERVERELQVGPEMQIFDNLEWRIYKEHYLIDLDLPRALYYEGKVYIVVPYIEYQFRVFYTVPKWGGVIIVDEDGNIEDLTPEEALKDERLKEFPIFPERLTRDIINAQNYWKEGVLDNIINLWIYHKDQIELIDVSNQGNRQPFLVITSDGKEYWMTAVEPYGKAYGLAAIYLMDAQSGEMSQIKFDTPLTGPVKAIDYVKKALPTFDWNQFITVEPIPVFMKGTLWWRIAVIPRTGSGIAKIAFVNAETKDVKIFESEKEVKEFLIYGQIRGEKPQEVSGTLEAIYSYTKNGNTHWVLVIGNTTIYANAAELSGELIYKLLTLKEGDSVVIKVSGERIVDIEKG